ncbi:tandem-95 repeat protein, partial [Pseudoalteromonas fenneropenaei]
AGGTLSGFSGSGTSYTATFTPTASSTTAATIDVAASTFTDAAGNNNTAATQVSMTVDTALPSITIGSNKTTLKASETATITFTLSESSTTFTSTDVTVAGGTLSGFSGSGTSYTATFTPTSDSNGTGTLDVSAATFTDSAGNDNTAATQVSISYDTKLPTVSLSSSAAAEVNDKFTVTITLSESSSDFVEQDLTLTNASSSNFTGSGTSYSVDITPTAEGSVAIDVAAGVFSDAAGNTNTAATQLTRSYDTTAPSGHSVDIDQTLINTSNESAFSFTFANAEVNSTFTYTVSDGVTSVSSSGSTSLTSATQQVTGIDVTNLNEGTLTLEVVVTDPAGNVASKVTDTVQKLYDIAPTVVNDSLTTDEDTAKQIDVLANDSDANNDMVASSAAIKTQPQKGTVSISNGVVTYTPNLNVNGSDSFTYTVKDAKQQESAVATVSVTITAVNDLPVAKTLTINTDEDTASSALSVRSEATDVEDTTPTGALALVTQPQKGQVTIDQTAGTFVYTPNSNANGSDSFTYTVTDSQGGVSAAATVNVNIGSVNDVPVANADSKTFDEDTVTTLDILSNDTDIEDSAFNNSSITLQDVGQGAGVYSFATVTIEQDGTLKITPTADVNGQHSFTYTVTDSGSAVSSAATVTLNITAINDAPVAVDNQAQLLEDGSFEVNVLGNDTDVDTGDSFDLTSVTVVKAPTKGTTQVTQTGAIVYTPTANSNGTDTFTYTVKDQAGAVSNEATVTMTVTPVNDAPLASSQTLTLNEDNSLTITLAATDIENDTLSYSIVTDVNNGTLTQQSTNTWVYTPTLNFNGSDSFVFKANDGTADSNEATVSLTINAVNDAPVADAKIASVNEDNSVTVTLTATDVENSALTYAIATAAQNGSASISGSTLTYVPNANFNGTDTIAITANDGELTSAVVNVVVTVNSVNDIPIISGSATTSVNEDTSYQFTPSASDVESSNLSFSIANQPSWASFNTATGTLSGVPGNSDVGVYNGIVITVSDGVDTASLPAFSITVVNVNDAPTINGVPATGVKQDENYLFTPTAADIDSPVLTFAISNKPVWATFDSATGSLAGTPTREHVGTTSGIVISVSDGQLSASLPAFSINVAEVNTAPTAANMQVSLKEDSTTSFVAAVSDIDKDVLTLAVLSGPTNGQLQVQGTTFSYTPSSNFNGNDSFTYQVSDGELSSAVATVNIVVTAVNDAPIAVADVFNLTATADNVYELDVLANDSDADGDALSIISAKTSLGTVTVSNGRLLLSPTGVITGPISVSYLVSDPQGATSRGEVTVNITSADNGGPVITAPADITVRAKGLFTKVDLGAASATDGNGQPLPVSLVDKKTVFPPGTHLVYWQVTDNQGRTAFATQNVHVEPLVSISKNSTVIENSSKTLNVYLNGTSPTYPVIVPYSVSGSATLADHNLADGEIRIESGTQGQVSFDIFADDITEGTENIVVSLSPALNLGAKSSTRIDIVEINVAPTLSLQATQNDEVRDLVTQSGGVVKVIAEVDDVNLGDIVTVDWNTKDLINQSNDPKVFEFDPTNVAAGIYTINATAKDNGSPAKSTKQTVYVEVIASLPTLTGQDSDGDLIPDDQEGFIDSDGDGIPDYLDAIDDCNVVQQRALESSRFLAEGSPGVCLRKGANVPQNQSGGVELFNTELLPDPNALNIGGIFDFIANGLPNVGDVYEIVLPQREPIPLSPVYRKFRAGEWVDFVVDDSNQLFSALGEKGYCPPPGDEQWQQGLTSGHWCVQLRIQDGGPNDDDGIANGSIVDPGGIAVMNNGNQLPLVVGDTATTRQGLVVTIDALANDSDADGDVLEITSAAVDFGAVVIEDNKLVYTPLDNLLGSASILYGVSDNKGGTASGEVVVDIKLNQAPVLVADSAQVIIGQTATIDVLDNDSDPEGDALILKEAFAAHGDVSITVDSQLKYVPDANFTGVDTITYYVQDALGAAASSTVAITVTKEQTPVTDNNVTAKSSGTWHVAMLLLTGIGGLLRRLRRNSFMMLPLVMCAYGLVHNNTVYAAEGWALEAGLVQSQATQPNLPDNWLGSNLSWDKKDSGFYLGANYQFTPSWAVGVSYQDLGDATASFSIPASAPAEQLAIAPVLGEGISLSMSYGIEVASGFKGEVFAGLSNWRADMVVNIASGTSHTNSISGTDPLLGIGASYQLTEAWDVKVKYQHERRDHNQVNSVKLGMQYRF